MRIPVQTAPAPPPPPPRSHTSQSVSAVLVMTLFRLWAIDRLASIPFKMWQFDLIDGESVFACCSLCDCVWVVFFCLPSFTLFPSYGFLFLILSGSVVLSIFLSVCLSFCSCCVA